MKKKFKNIEYTVSSNPYAPEQTKAYMVVIGHPTKYRAGGNHSYYELPLDYDERKRLHHDGSRQGKEHSVAKLKKLIREKYNHQRYKTRLMGFVHLIEGTPDVATVNLYRVSENASLQAKLEAKRKVYETLQAANFEKKSNVETGSIKYTENGVVAEKEETPMLKISKQAQVRRYGYENPYKSLVLQKQREKQDRDKRWAEKYGYTGGK